MPTIGEAASINGDDQSLDGRARHLWETLVGKCIGHNIPVRSTPSGNGYLFNGSINTTIHEIWPDLLLKDGRETPVSKSFVSTLKNHLRANKNVNFEVVRGQLFISATYHEPKVKVKRSNPVRVITTPPDEMSILEKSKKIWTRARNYCSNNSRPFQVIEGVTFWECDKPLNYFVKAEFPDLHDFERQKRPLYDFLRSTTNAINIGSKTDESMKDGEHHWLIRDDWCEAGNKVIFRSPRNPDNIDRRAAKLTEHEAGEDRTPEPVVIKQQDKAPEEADMPKPVPTPPLTVPETPETPETPKPEAESKPVTCPDCGIKWKNVDALSAHSKVHKTPAALKQVVKAVEQGAIDARKVVDLTDKVESLTDQLAQVKAELELAKRDGDASTLMELLTDVLAKCSNGSISPMRAIADVDDLLRTTKGQS